MNPSAGIIKSEKESSEECETSANMKINSCKEEFDSSYEDESKVPYQDPAHIGWWLFSNFNLTRKSQPSNSNTVEYDSKSFQEDLTTESGNFKVEGDVSKTMEMLAKRAADEAELLKEMKNTKAGPSREIDLAKKYKEPYKFKEPFQCSECPYSTVWRRDINRHIESVHLGVKCYTCPLCDYKANYRNNIKRHVSSVHNGEKPFKCPLCEHRTGDRGHLKSHIKAVHCKEKPFACSVGGCNYHASKRTDLNIHIRSVHEKIKSHHCPHCHYQASKSGNLNRHIKAIHNLNENHGSDDSNSIKPVEVVKKPRRSFRVNAKEAKNSILNGTFGSVDDNSP